MNTQKLDPTTECFSFSWESDRQKATIRAHGFLIPALITHRINGPKGGGTGQTGTMQGAHTGGNTHSQGRSGGRFVAIKSV